MATKKFGDSFLREKILVIPIWLVRRYILVNLVKFGKNTEFVLSSKNDDQKFKDSFLGEKILVEFFAAACTFW